MDKQLYYTLNGGACDNLIMSLTDCMKWIKDDIGEMTEVKSANVQFTITPVWMTKKEFENLPEAED